MSGVGTITHGIKVRALYKAILKLHRGLPLHFQAVGDQYLKDEFRRHKTVNEQETSVFMGEWTKYYVTLAKQLAVKNSNRSIGQELSPQVLDNFNAEQLGQLVELLKETKKPISDDAPR